MGWLDNWAQDDGASSVKVPDTGALDLSNTVVAVDGTSERQQLYGSILVKQVYQRSRITWKLVTDTVDTVGDAEDATGTTVVTLTVDDTMRSWVGAEGYVIEVKDDKELSISGATDRAVLFGVGRLLRELYLDFNITYATPLKSVCYLSSENYKIVSTPAFGMRQHQVAYRPKTNSYDAFTPEMMRQEILDLALFGTNGIEVIPPGIDDAMQSPQFSVGWYDMLSIVSKWCDDLDITLSIWYPAYFAYDTQEDLQKAMDHWKSVFSVLTRLDFLFVPGGDPGGRPAADFFRIVEQQAKFLRSNHFPQCQVWVSSQYALSMSHDLGTEVWVPLNMELDWIDYLSKPQLKEFLDGVVYGPWSAHPIDEFRALVPSHFPLRNYPDLCHVQTAELPVVGWDLSFATTNSRESINPRPKEMMRMIEEQSPYTIGCGCYSEGVNDDVNKYVWTALHWGDDIEGPLAHGNPEDQLNAMLRQYASYLMEQCRNVDALVEIILGLERNWKGSALKNQSIPDTMQRMIALDEGTSPRHRRNWRYNMLQFRVHHDVFVRLRLVQEVANVEKGMEMLGESNNYQVIESTALQNALMKIAVPYHEPAMTLSSFSSPSNPDALNIIKLHATPTVTHLYGRLMALAALLFQQIGYQLSVGFGGQHRQRGAYMDLIWAPVGDVTYLNRVFTLQLENEPMSERDRALVNRFTQSYRERHGRGSLQVVWYCSFGDNGANETPGVFEQPTRRAVPVTSVLPPYRKLELGEDPYFFTRPLIEYLDCSNDQVLKDLHNGFIPRAWRSYLVPIWPRTAKFNMHFDLTKLHLDTSKDLFVRITYLGKDLNRHGGDWEELNREAMPVSLRANGFTIHQALEPPEVTATRDYLIPRKAVARAREVNNLILSFIPSFVDKTTFRYVPLPIAEMWILESNFLITKRSFL